MQFPSSTHRGKVFNQKITGFFSQGATAFVTVVGILPLGRISGMHRLSTPEIVLAAVI